MRRETILRNVPTYAPDLEQKIANGTLESLSYDEDLFMSGLDSIMECSLPARQLTHICLNIFGDQSQRGFGVVPPRISHRGKASGMLSTGSSLPTSPTCDVHERSHSSSANMCATTVGQRRLFCGGYGLQTAFQEAHSE